MKRLLIIAMTALGLVFGAVGYAQPKPAAAPQEKKMKGHHDDGYQGLNLTEEQRARIKEIRQQAKADAAKATDEKAKREIRRAANEKIKNEVLTAEQRAKLEQMRKEIRCPVLNKLNLTEDQKAKVKEIMATAREDAKKAPDKEAKKAIFKAAWEKIKNQVLTAEQRTKLEELKAQHKEKAEKQPKPEPAPAK